MEKIEGYLEVGANENGEIVINHPDLKPDENGVGHIVFSPGQARNLARLLLKNAEEIEAAPISSKVFTFPYLVTLQLDEEQDVIARIPELPGCTAHGADVEEALRYLKEVMDLWLEENWLAPKEHE